MNVSLGGWKSLFNSKSESLKKLFLGSFECAKEIYVQFYGVLGHAKALTDFFLTHLLGIEFDNLTYFAHTDRFIRHDFLFTDADKVQHQQLKNHHAKQYN